MIRGAGVGAAMGASGEVKAVFLWVQGQRDEARMIPPFCGRGRPDNGRGRPEDSMS